MNTSRTVHCATAIILIICLLTEKCYSRNVEDNVQFILSERQNVKFLNKLQQSALTVQPNNHKSNNKLWDLENPLDILEDKDELTQQAPPSSEYLKIEGDKNSNDKIRNRVSRQINNGYSSIYPSLPTFNPNAQNMYSTPYKTPGPQYNGYSLNTTYPYNPSNVNSFNDYAKHYQFPQNTTFQASVPSFNYGSTPSYYPHGQHIFPNNSTNPKYIQNNWHNQSSAQNLNQYNLYNNAQNYSRYPNTTNFNPNSYNTPNFYNSPNGYNSPNNYNTPKGYNRPNGYNSPNGYNNSYNTSNFYNSPNGYNSLNSYNTPNGYNRPNGYNSPNGYNNPNGYNGPNSYSTSPNFSSPNYPTYNPSAINANIRSNNSWVSNYSQNATFNPYYTPKIQTSKQNYSVNPSNVYNSSYPNYRNPQTYNNNNYYNRPQNNSYFNNKNQFTNPFGGTTLSNPYQNNLHYLNQSSYTQTTPISTPNFKSNTRPQNNFGGPNQSHLTEPNHFFYTPGGNNINGSVNYNLPHKYYK